MSDIIIHGLEEVMDRDNQFGGKGENNRFLEVILFL